MRKSLVYGHGINDLGGKPEWYDVWRGVLRRSFDEKFFERRPTYVGTTVCEEWLTFSAFSRWMNDNGGIFGVTQIDKDIIKPGNKHYSPETCVCVSSALNNILTMSGNGRSQYGIGVRIQKSGRFGAEIRIDGKTAYLGTYDIAEEASNAYVLKKCEILHETAELQTDERIKQGLLLHAIDIRKKYYTVL